MKTIAYTLSSNSTAENKYKTLFQNLTEHFFSLKATVRTATCDNLKYFFNFSRKIKPRFSSNLYMKYEALFSQKKKICFIM